MNGLSANSQRSKVADKTNHVELPHHRHPTLDRTGLGKDLLVFSSERTKLYREITWHQRSVRNVRKATACGAGGDNTIPFKRIRQFRNRPGFFRI